jgi:hypothetical protein
VYTQPPTKMIQVLADDFRGVSMFSPLFSSYVTSFWA